jgi:hypothetical protein
MTILMNHAHPKRNQCYVNYEVSNNLSLTPELIRFGISIWLKLIISFTI